MRLPDETLKSVAFLAVRDANGRPHFAGTAFVVSVTSEAEDLDPEFGVTYLVTARHCVEKAAQYGDLYMRLNTTDGKSGFVRINRIWHYGENEADDVAVIPVAFDQARIESSPIPISMAVTEVLRQRHHIGIGDDLCCVGLFTSHHGRRRNNPIMRTGVIAAMPHEPLQDAGSGLEYDAYLAEIRSIGGLSGSPVFVVLQWPRTIRGSGPAAPPTTWEVYLLGLIRGHWQKQSVQFADYLDSETESLNTGIAIVTPVDKVLEIINSEELMKDRKRAYDEERKQSAPQLDNPAIEDSALPPWTGTP